MLKRSFFTCFLGSRALRPTTSTLPAAVYLSPVLGFIGFREGGVSELFSTPQYDGVYKRDPSINLPSFHLSSPLTVEKGMRMGVQGLEA